MDRLQKIYSSTRKRKYRKAFEGLSEPEITEIVNDIRYARLVQKTPIRELVDHYGLDKSVVHRIGTGQSYRNVPLDARMRRAIKAIEAKVDQS